MDRAEVKSIDETVTVPAGKFEKCWHMHESSGLEKDTSVKMYAPGVGLIKDDEMDLVKIENGGK